MWICSANQNVFELIIFPIKVHLHTAWFLFLWGVFKVNSGTKINIQWLRFGLYDDTHENCRFSYFFNVFFPVLCKYSVKKDSPIRFRFYSSSKSMWRTFGNLDWKRNNKNCWAWVWCWNQSSVLPIISFPVYQFHRPSYRRCFHHDTKWILVIGRAWWIFVLPLRGKEMNLIFRNFFLKIKCRKARN